jgi:hypothetical protein
VTLIEKKKCYSMIDKNRIKRINNQTIRFYTIRV